jgi:pimeloyl-ACP methyl ester carboxylesterase
MPHESFEKLQVDGAQIAYRRIGNGRPLVALNGFAATSADWDPSFIDRLASSNELILLDNRGIGRSTDNGRPFDIAQLADDAARVIEMLGIERANVLGWSMGGFHCPDARLAASGAYYQTHLAIDGPRRSRRRSRLSEGVVTTHRYVRDAPWAGASIAVVGFSE